MILKLPYDPRYKFQPGDICEITKVRDGQKVFDSEKYEGVSKCMVLSGKGGDYYVYLFATIPRNIVYYCSEDSDRSEANYRECSLSWMYPNQLKFLRKPNIDEIKILVSHNDFEIRYYKKPSIFNSEHDQYRLNHTLSDYVLELYDSYCKYDQDHIQEISWDDGKPIDDYRIVGFKELVIEELDGKTCLKFILETEKVN